MAAGDERYLDGKLVTRLEAAGDECSSSGADGHLGIWGALCNATPRRKSSVAGITASSISCPNASSPRPYCAPDPLCAVQAGFPGVVPKQRLGSGGRVDQDWDRMVSFYNYPKQQWQHLRTTNPVESPFAGLRLRTDAAKRFKKVNNAQAVIWKMLLVAEKRFRRLKAPELMRDVYQGAKYVNGVLVNQESKEKAA